LGENGGRTRHRIGFGKSKELEMERLVFKKYSQLVSPARSF
jgi:hypothetical protein